MPRNGFPGAVTWMPAACTRSITALQLEASANAPWTRTTVRGARDVCSDTRAPSLVGIDVDDGVGKRFRCFLWKVVADSALDRAVRIPARELAGVGTRVGVRGSVRVALERDRRHGDHGLLRQAVAPGRRIPPRLRRVRG